MSGLATGIDFWNIDMLKVIYCLQLSAYAVYAVSSFLFSTLIPSVLKVSLLSIARISNTVDMHYVRKMTSFTLLVSYLRKLCVWYR